jgi:hypothetical protein
MSEREQTEWGGLRYVYTGRYSIYSMPEKNPAMLQSGTYRAEVVVSWRQARIVATRITIE